MTGDLEHHGHGGLVSNMVMAIQREIGMAIHIPQLSSSIKWFGLGTAVSSTSETDISIT